MRIHTDHITTINLEMAAKKAGVGLMFRQHGSRKRDRAFEVRLSGSGVQGGQFGNTDFKVATWDEWGIFLAHLFARDPNAEAGPYKGDDSEDYESFSFMTDGRYDSLTPADQHKRHRFDFVGVFPTFGFLPGMVQSYAEQECKCGAVRRSPMTYVEAEKASV